MLHRDFLLRQIEQFIRALLDALGLLKSGSVEVARDRLARMADEVVGLPLTLLRHMPEDQLMAMLRPASEFDSPRAFYIGQLLYADALAREAEGVPEGQLRTALTLLLAAWDESDRFRIDPGAEAIDDLQHRLAGAVLPLPLLRALMTHEEQRGRFARAEDRLFELLERGDPDAPAWGRAFLRRLLTRDDADLKAGDLPRDEVEDALRVLERRFPV